MRRSLMQLNIRHFISDWQLN